MNQISQALSLNDMFADGLLSEAEFLDRVKKFARTL